MSDFFTEALSLPPPEFCRRVGIDYDVWQRGLAQLEYVHFKIRKRSGGYRDVHAPRKRLKKAQRQLARVVGQSYYPVIPQCVFGYVPREAWPDDRPRDIVANAHSHADSAYLLNVDIDDFFPSISTEKLMKMWRHRYPQTHTRLLGEIVTLVTFDDCLPVGAPSSPILSNWYCLDLDKKIAAFAKTHELVYTRYVDDLSFSSWEPWAESVESNLIGLISDAGFDLNAEKRKWFGPADEKIVTGVRFDGSLRGELHVPAGFAKNCKACIEAYRQHLWFREVSGPAPWLKHKLRFLERSINGQIAHVERIEGKQSKLAVKLLKLWRSSKKASLHFLDGYHGMR